MASQSGSPGLVIPCAYDPPGGVPPNMTVLAAQAAAIIPNNIQPTNVVLGPRPRSLLECQSNAGAQGYRFNGVNGTYSGNNSAGGSTMNDPSSGAGSNSILVGVNGAALANPPTFQG